MTEPASLPFFVGVDLRQSKTIRMERPRQKIAQLFYDLYGPSAGAIDLPRDRWSEEK